jgi:anti-sigma-K factor RskA
LNHDAVVELLGAYALDAVDPQDAAAVEAHLGTCPGCRDEIARLHEAAGALAGPGEDPPPGLWDGIATRLSRPDGGSKPRIRGGSPRLSSRPARRVTAVLAVAAAAAITVLAVEVAHLNHRLDQVAAGTATRNLSESARQALLDPRSDHIALTGPGPGGSVRAEVVVIEGSETAFLFNQGLPALPAAQSYQLWLIGGPRPVSLGLLGADPGTVAFAVGAIPVTSAFAVSVEPARGSTAPTQAPVAASAV